MPQADRRRLARWSDVVMAQPGHGVVDSWEQKRGEMFEYGSYFLNLWNQRVNAPPAGDLISMLAHGPATRNMNQFEYLGNIILLTIGGNDTTRNTISGSVLALNQNPDQYAKLRADPSLIPSMVSETIRWQTPLAHMRRTAKQNLELGPKQIRKGDRQARGYISGNRDEELIERPNDYLDRPRASAPAPVVRLRHPSLRRQPPGRAAAAGDLGRNPAALSPRSWLRPSRSGSYSTFVKGYENLPGGDPHPKLITVGADGSGFDVACPGILAERLRADGSSQKHRLCREAEPTRGRGLPVCFSCSESSSAAGAAGAQTLTSPACVAPGPTPADSERPAAMPPKPSMPKCINPRAASRAAQKRS